MKEFDVCGIYEYASQILEHKYIFFSNDLKTLKA